MNYDKAHEAYARVFKIPAGLMQERTRSAVRAAVDAAFGGALAPGPRPAPGTECVCARMTSAAKSYAASLAWTCSEHGPLTMDTRPLPAPEVHQVTPRRGERA